MAPYEQSVQSVDAALDRLKATLAMYKLSETKPGVNSSSTPKDVKGPAVQYPTLQHGTAQDPVRQQAAPQDPVWREVLALRSGHQIAQIQQHQIQQRLADVKHIYSLLNDHPYCLPLYLVLAQKQIQLGYPDLAASAAYKAVLLSDAIQDEADEYHDDACDAVREVILQQSIYERISLLKEELHREAAAGPGIEHDVEVDLWLRKHYESMIYHVLWHSLTLCECYKSAYLYASRGLQLFPDASFSSCISVLKQKISVLHGITVEEVTRDHPPPTWPDKGHVRREQYVWNTFEPDRLGNLDTLNEMMTAVAPKLEIRIVELPALNPGTSEVVTQLGVFTKEDIAPGEAILEETSMLTANNKLQDALCDACSTDLPPLHSPAAESIISCPDCQNVFCSQKCFDLAMDQYHPALCERDVEAIAKDVPPAEAADSLYALLLLRALAMAETQNLHPLELPPVKYIWADYALPSLVASIFVPPTTDPMHPDPDSHQVPRLLPFSFDHNIRLPFHMLEKMDLDIFANPQYDVWVFNTLYAKFRGTASARLSGLGGRAIRGPEVSAVHTMWCMANHSCDPNVGWEWGGSIKFWAREERVAWAMGEEEKGVRSRPGLRKGEEVLNHYCDVELPVAERREWAKGSLGGDCMCTRCVYEAREAKQKK